MARMGDLNLYSSDDDQFAQQYTIAQIIRHPDHTFKFRYNDLALMKLEKDIKYVFPVFSFGDPLGLNPQYQFYFVVR